MNEPVVYLNGEFLPMSEATVSVMDRGFLFADSVYEVVPAYGGRLFRLSEHLQRLDNSLHAIGMSNPMPHKHWEEVLQTLIKPYPDDELSVYLQITRGAAPGRDHAIPQDIPPTVFAYASPIQTDDLAQIRQGIRAITLDDIRWHRCNLKTTALLANVLLKQQAKQQGAKEAILIREGLAVEGTASNLFVVTDGVIITPPKSESLLPGITRDLVLELAREHDIPNQEQPIPTDQLFQADEIWLTSSTKEVMPVITLNDQAVGDGAPGPMFHSLCDLYTRCKTALKNGP